MPEVVSPAGSRAVAIPRTGVRIVVLLAAAIVACLSVAGMFLVASPPASAHDQLLSTDPADGDTLDSMPAQIALTFSGEPLTTGAEVVLTGDDGKAVPLEGITVDGAVLTAPLPPSLPGGEYRTAWHIVSGDGHPLEGAFSFTVESAEAPEGAAAESERPADAAEEPAEDADQAAGSASASDDAAGNDAAAGDDAAAGEGPYGSLPGTTTGTSTGTAVLVTVGALAVVLLMIVVMRRKLKDSDALRERERLRGRGDGAAATSGGDAGDTSERGGRSSDTSSDSSGGDGGGSDGGGGGGE